MYIDFDEREAIKIAELEGPVEQGIEKGHLEVAGNLLSMGLSLEQISKATGISLKILKRLKVEQNNPSSH